MCHWSPQYDTFLAANVTSPPSSVTFRVPDVTFANIFGDDLRVPRRIGRRSFGRATTTASRCSAGSSRRILILILPASMIKVTSRVTAGSPHLSAACSGEYRPSRVDGASSLQTRTHFGRLPQAEARDAPHRLWEELRATSCLFARLSRPQASRPCASGIWAVFDHDARRWETRPSASPAWFCDGDPEPSGPSGPLAPIFCLELIRLPGQPLRAAMQQLQAQPDQRRADDEGGVQKPAEVAAVIGDLEPPGDAETPAPGAGRILARRPPHHPAHRRVIWIFADLSRRCDHVPDFRAWRSGLIALVFGRRQKAESLAEIL